MSRFRFTVIEDTPEGPLRRTYIGRTGWTLAQLVSAGERGVTPIERPAPRWSHYVFCLRRDGLDIETIEETHDGAFPGSHGRYVLRTPLTVADAGSDNATL